jgi:hypothetical protein
LQKPTGGAPRETDDVRSTRANATATSLLSRLTSRAARALMAGMHGRAVAAGSALAATARPFTRPERALPIAVSAIVAVAALLAFLPATPQGAVGGVQGRGTDVRLAVNGGIERVTPVDPSAKGDSVATDTDPLTGVALADPEAAAFVDRSAPEAPAEPSFVAVTLPGYVTTMPAESTEPAAPVTDDGTVLAGYAPLTTVEDGADLIRTY